MTLTRRDLAAFPSVGSRHSVSLLGDVIDDWQAIDVWLQLLRDRESSAATLATYAREVRRLRWYYDTQSAPAPRTWSFQDVSTYKKFLATRLTDFLCPPGRRPGQAGWTPFRSEKLSAQSINAAMRILNSLFRFWLQAGYVQGNPFSQSIAKQHALPAHGARHAIPLDILAQVHHTLREQPKIMPVDHLAYWRDVFLLLLLERTGLRANEVGQANLADVHQLSHPKQMTVHWAIRIRHQKGGGEGIVPLDADVMQALREYRRAFGLAPEPAHDELHALILSPRTQAAVNQRYTMTARSRRANVQWQPVRTRQAIWGIVRRAFEATAKQVGEGGTANLLRQASTHWLRHTRGTSLTLQGNELRTIAAFMRHRDPRTTMGYTNLAFFDLVDALVPKRPPLTLEYQSSVDVF